MLEIWKKSVFKSDFFCERICLCKIIKILSFFNIDICKQCGYNISGEW